MKTTLILGLIILFPLIGFSQSNSSIDIVTGIEYSYRNLSISNQNEILVRIMDNRNQVESGKLNWRFGFNYNQKLTKYLYFKTGLRLASIGHKGEKRTGLIWPSESEDGVFVADPNLPSESQLIFDNWFIEIPLAIRFQSNSKKLNPFVEIGASPSIYLTTKTKHRTDINSSNEFSRNNDINKLQWVGFISLGANYNWNESIQFFGQPTIRYHLTKIAEGIIDENLYNFGIEVGVRKLLNTNGASK